MKRIVLIVVVLALALFTLPALTEGVSYDVTITSFTPAAHGTAAYPDGVSGAITFTVTVAKGAQKQTTQPITLAINAAPYAGVSDAQAVEAARAALEGHEDECFFAYGSGEAGRIEAVVTSCEEALSAVPDAAGVTLSPTFAALGGDEYTVTLDITKGEVPARATATAKFFIVETADPRIAEGVAAITGAMDGVKLPVPSTSGNPPDNYPGVVDAAAALAFPVPSDMTVQRTDVAYTAPTDGTPDNQYGDDGAYSFYYTVGNVAQPHYDTVTTTFALPVAATALDAHAFARNIMSEYLPSSLTNPPDEDKQAALVSQINALLTTANEQYNAYALDVGVSVLPISNVLYTAAADGTSADAVGTSGEMTYQVDYDVTYPEGGSSRYTLVVDFATTIEPVLYEGVMDEQAVEAARAALEGKALGYLSYAYDSGESGKVAAAMAACSTALASVPDAAGVVLAVSLAEDTSVPVISMPHSAPVDNCIVTVQIAKGAHFATAAATCSLTEAKDPRIDATLTAIENAVAGITLPQYDTPDMMVYYQYVDDIVQTVVPSGMSAAYNQDSVFSPFSIVLPINGTTENQYGTDGSFVFAYSVSNNDQSYYNSITRTFTLTAPAKPLDVLAYAARLVWNADYPETFEYSDSADFPASIVSTVQGIANTALAPYAEAGLQPAASPIVRQMNYTAPVHGTPSAPDGTQGAMKIALGVQLADTSNTSVQYGFAINPIPYDTRLTNAKSALEAGFGSAVATSEGDVQSAVQASIADRVTDIMTAYKGEHATFGSVTSSISYGAYTAPVDGATGSPQGTSGSQAFTVTLSNALGQTVTTGTITQTIAADDITLSEAQRIASIALLPGSFSINSYTGAAYTTAAAGAEAVAYVGNIVQNALNGSAGLGSVTKSVSAANVQDTGLYYHNAFSATVNVTLSYGGASVSLPSTSMQVSMYPEPTGFLNSYIASYDEEFSNKTISVDAASNTADGCKQQITYAQVSNIYSVHMDIVTDSFVAATETTPGSYAYHVMYTLSPGGFTANSQGYTATVNLVTPE